MELRSGWIIKSLQDGVEDLVGHLRWRSTTSQQALKSSHWDKPLVMTQPRMISRTLILKSCFSIRPPHSLAPQRSEGWSGLWYIDPQSVLGSRQNLIPTTESIELSYMFSSIAILHTYMSLHLKSFHAVSNSKTIYIDWYWRLPVVGSNARSMVIWVGMDWWIRTFCPTVFADQSYHQQLGMAITCLVPRPGLIEPCAMACSQI